MPTTFTTLCGCDEGTTETRPLTQLRHHGWAAARADLNDPENFKQYEDVYQRLADYFARVDCSSE